MVSKLLLMVLVLLGVVGIAISSNCPSRKSISPCSCMDNGEDLELFCHDEDITLDDLKKILETFDKDFTLYLDFYYMNLGTVPTDYFKGLNIRVINFAHCTYEQIPDEEGRILVGLEDTLEEFMVQSTIERHNSPLALDLSHLNKLNELHFSYNEIPELTDNWFKKGPSSLTFLNINGNEIERLGNNAFANLPNLEHLNLEDNQFGAMNRSMLPNPANHLEELHLNENGLESFPEDFFTQMPELTHLSLEDNDFINLPQATFGEIWSQLDYINLSGNKMDCENSTLQWMADSKYTPQIYGLCVTPPNRRNRRIRSIIKEIRRGHD